jgi:putative acetyltransferase
MLRRVFKSSMSNIQIVTFADGLAKEFERLNRAWIERYFIVEATDLAIFKNPRESIVDPGGQIFFAQVDGTTVGACAAQKLSITDWELAKLGVDEKYQGRGIGRLLCKKVIEFCWFHGAKRIIIETNSVLVPALSLYYSLGFRKFTPESKSSFTRADTFLELYTPRS